MVAWSLAHRTLDVDACSAAGHSARNCFTFSDRSFQLSAVPALHGRPSRMTGDSSPDVSPTYHSGSGFGGVILGIEPDDAMAGAALGADGRAGRGTADSFDCGTAGWRDRHLDHVFGGCRGDDGDP